MTQLKDSYANWENSEITLGNALVERKISWREGVPYSASLVRKKSGFSWKGRGDAALFEIPGLDLRKSELSFSTQTLDFGGRVAPFLRAAISMRNKAMEARLELDVFPELTTLRQRLWVRGKYAGKSVSRKSPESSNPIESETSKNREEDSDWIENIPFSDRHIKLTSLHFHDQTDHHDQLVVQNESTPYHHRLFRSSGNIFLLNRYLSNEALILAKESPTPGASLSRECDELLLSCGQGARLVGSGISGGFPDSDDFFPAYGSSVTLGTPSEVSRDYFRYNDLATGVERPRRFAMTNTWGDRHQDKAISEAFLLKEISAAGEIGADFVMIDDGWQKGTTANSAIKKGGPWEGYHANDPHFWDVHPEKFPSGLAPLVAACKARGAELALWFSPDSSNDFKNWSIDLEILSRLHQTYGIRAYKLDGIKIRSKLGERNFLKLIEGLYARCGKDLLLCLDVTAEIRFGYFYETQSGVLFLENRYTDWGNYHPHRTLRNLWDLSQWIPSRRFQIEILNPKRNPEKYLDDPLAPNTYPVDYLLAIALFAQPLFWMETCFLEAEDRKRIAALMTIWKEERPRLDSAEIIPIGKRPDGKSITGFQARTGKGSGELLLFREHSDHPVEDVQLVELPDTRLRWEKIAGNLSDKEWGVEESDGPAGNLKVRLGKPASYLWLRYRPV